MAQAFAATPDITGIDTSLRADAPRAFLRVNRQRAETLGIPVASIAATVHGALSGVDAAWLHDGQAKYPVPVRLQLPREAQVGLDALLALPLRAANGQLVPLSELVRVERGVIDKPLFTKDLQGVSYVFADVAPVARHRTRRCTACSASARGSRRRRCRAPASSANTGSASPPTPTASTR